MTEEQVDLAAMAARALLRTELRAGFPHVHETPLMRWDRLAEGEREAWRKVVRSVLAYAQEMER